MKKILMSLVAVLTFAVLTACGSADPAPPAGGAAAPAPAAGGGGAAAAPAAAGDEDLVLRFSIAHSQDPRALPPNEMYFTSAFNARMNAEIDFISIPGEGAGERVNIMLASRDLPDVFMGLINRDHIMRHMYDDLFIPVCYYIDNHMPLLTYVLNQRPQYRAMMIAPDGQIWGFPYIEEMHGLILNQGVLAVNHVWLDNLGLNMPTNLDEFVYVLRAFRDRDPNGNGLQDEIPFTWAGRDGNKGLGAWANGNDIGQFMGLWGQADRGDSLYLDANNQIFFTAAHPAFREMNRFFHELFAEGLIDQEVFNNGGGELSAKLRDGVVGFVINFSLPDRMPAYRFEEFSAVPYMRSELGIWGTRENLSEMHRPTTFVITTAMETPLWAALYADGFYDPQTSVEANWGPLGYVYVFDENGQMVWGELQDGFDTFDDMRARHTLGGRQPLAILDHFYGTVVEYPQNAQLILDHQRDMGFFDYHFESPYIPPLWFTVEEANRLAVLTLQIYGNTVNPMRRGWIMDGGVDDDWYDYLELLERNGLPEFLEIMQTAFDRMRAGL